MSEKEEIEALNAENSTLRDIIDEQNESIAELRQQVAELQETMETYKSESLAVFQSERVSDLESIQKRNDVLKQWLDKGLTWESMFAQVELENTRLRQALKALTS